jgi:hypothetical protein
MQALPVKAPCTLGGCQLKVPTNKTASCLLGCYCSDLQQPSTLTYIHSANCLLTWVRKYTQPCDVMDCLKHALLNLQAGAGSTLCSTSLHSHRHDIDASRVVIQFPDVGAIDNVLGFSKLSFR